MAVNGYESQITMPPDQRPASRAPREASLGMNRPSLFIVGHSKSGTTALARFLGAHPSVFMSTPKEPNFFARDFTAGVTEGSFTERSEASYLALFEEARPDQVAGEASASYLYSRVAAEEIARFNPDAKIIIMLREPVSFLQSYHLQKLKNPPADAEDIWDFEQALAAEEDRKHGRRLPPRCQVPQLLYYSERVRYAEQVARYLAHFPRENVLVIVYDDFERDNRRVFREVLSFVGVDPSFEPEFRTYNRGALVRDKRLQSLVGEVAHGRGAFALIHRPVTWLLPAGVRKRLVRSVYERVVFREKPALSPELVARLKARFRPEVVRISELLGRDLIQLWRY